jgi:hypothetical protein
VDGKFIVKDAEGNPATFENREDAVYDLKSPG